MYFTPPSVLDALPLTFDAVLGNPPFERSDMQRGDRVKVNFSALLWPGSVVFPHGRTGTVMEVMGPKSVVVIDGSSIEWISNIYLEVIADERQTAD